MTDKETLDFIRANEGGDVRRLAFQAARYPGVDMPYALDQIAGRQAARRKLPSWAVVDDMVYPPHLSMEQCSGEAAARYKAGVAARMGAKGRLVDLTGGFGVDFAFMAPCFASATYVERQEHLCDIARHNFALLGLDGVEVVCADGTDYLKSMERADMIYIDPARRDSAGGRTFAIADCTPDVLSLRDTLLDKAGTVMIKLSPMLDWRKAVADMGGCVREVHIVSVGGECKELLLVARPGKGLTVHCVNDGADFDFDAEAEIGGAGRTAAWQLPGGNNLEQLAGWHLYEPNASVMKAGCFGLIEQRCGVKAVGADSHLFLRPEAADGFPGRGFVVERATTLNKRALKEALRGIEKANIAVRNFPMSVDALRRRLKIGEGGGVYIFATTLADRTHVLLICSKISKNQL